MRIRTVMGFAVLSAAVLLSCSGGDGPIAPPPPPVTTISISAPSTSAMAKDTMVVTMVVSNATSCTPEVSGVARILDVTGCTSYRVVFETTGLATLSAKATGTSGTVSAEAKSVTVNARPIQSTLDTLSVDLFSPEESDSPPVGMKMRAVWTKNGTKDSVEVAMSNGVATTEIPISLDSVKMRFEGDSRYAPRTLVFYRGDYFQKRVSVILEPRNWKIRSAQFAGQVLETSIAIGSVPSGPTDQLSYLRFINIAKNTGGITKVLRSWPAEKLPIPVGIVWSQSVGTNPPSDSAYFTNTILPLVNQYLGRTVFVPGRITGDTIPVGMVGIVLGNAPRENPGQALGPDWYDVFTGEIYKASVILPSRLYLEASQTGVIVHEFMHNLGVGHTCSWVTRMVSSAEFTVGTNCIGKGSNNLSPMDIAMYEFATAIRDMAKKKNTVFAFN